MPQITEYKDKDGDIFRVIVPGPEPVLSVDLRVPLLEKNERLAGDNRGKIYTTTNLRTLDSWTLTDSEHSCGGA